MPMNPALMTPEALAIFAAGIIIGLWIMDKHQARQARRARPLGNLPRDSRRRN